MLIWAEKLADLIEQVGPFGVVFVDNRPGESRKFIVNWVRDHTDVVVLHDTENLAGGETEPVLSTFPFRYTFKTQKPWTDVVAMKPQRQLMSTLFYKT